MITKKREFKDLLKNKLIKIEIQLRNYNPFLKDKKNRMKDLE